MTRSSSLKGLLLLIIATTIIWSCQEQIVEGQHAGDCEDGADNDMDGLFDCSDDGCTGSPVCENSGLGDDDDSQGDDDDTSQGDDDTSQGDDDTFPQGDDDDSQGGGGQGGGGQGGGQGGSGEGQSQNCQASSCPECTNGLDDDNDGMIDCADDSCAEFCGGGGQGGGGGEGLPPCCKDQSCPNMSDCGDPPGDDDDSHGGGGQGGGGHGGGGQGGTGEGQGQSCTASACPECTNGIDDDNDGMIDCDDDSCSEFCGAPN